MVLGLWFYEDRSPKYKVQIIKMRCENLQFDLPLYAENALRENEQAALDEHLVQCPLCRVKLAEFQSLRNDFLSLAQPEMPNDLLSSVKNVVAAKLKRAERKSVPLFSSSFRHWLQYRLMPYSVGTVASVLITSFLLFTLLSTKEATRQGVENSQLGSNRAALIAANRSPVNPNPLYYGGEYSLGDLPISDEAPSVNPAGALMALTKSIVRGKMKDEEVVIVADVFGDGIAKIAEVVEPPSDKRAMQDLQTAMNDKNSSAPFVPASYDNRAQVVRVIFKIQRVDVIEKSNQINKKSLKR